VIRKLTVVLLTGVMCLIGTNSLLAKNVEVYSSLQEYEEATGKTIEKFNEAPMLREKVAIGELPPVEERLPEEPLVVDPAETIGEYGGILRRVWTGMVDPLEDLIREFPLMYSSDMQKIIPNILKSWEVSKDAKTYILHIRKGIKWSDGYPFTADDFMFYYTDMALNKSLYPTGVSFLKIGGEMGKMEKIDDYTIKLSFAVRYGILPERLCRWRPVPYAPKHFLKQFHPNYVPKDELDKIVKKEGFDSWVNLFTSKSRYQENSETPTIAAWKMINRVSDPVNRLVRNPYYWKIDTAGNQLPYMDGIDQLLCSDTETMLLKVVAGDVDYVNGVDIDASGNFTLLKQNEKKGNYDLTRSIGWCDEYGAVFFNFSSKDPILREIFRNKRFRIALSLAMNADEINEIMFKGQYITSQPAPPDGPPYHGELSQFHVYTQYDPQLANQLLDTMGLKWNKDRTVRLRSDGKPLELVLNTGMFYGMPRIAEMQKKYWKDIGIETTVKPLSGDLLHQRISSGDYDLSTGTYNIGGVRPIITALRENVVPIIPEYWGINPKWALWCVTNGKEGEEPPRDVKRLHEIHKEFVGEPDADKRATLEREIYLIFCENLWVISPVRKPSDSRFLVFSNRVGNVRKPQPSETYYGVPSSWYLLQK